MKKFFQGSYSLHNFPEQLQQPDAWRRKQSGLNANDQNYEHEKEHDSD